MMKKNSSSPKSCSQQSLALTNIAHSTSLALKVEKPRNLIPSPHILSSSHQREYSSQDLGTNMPPVCNEQTQTIRLKQSDSNNLTLTRYTGPFHTLFIPSDPIISISPTRKTKHLWSQPEHQQTSSLTTS